VFFFQASKTNQTLIVYDFLTFKRFEIEIMLIRLKTEDSKH